MHVQYLQISQLADAVTIKFIKLNLALFEPINDLIYLMRTLKKHVKLI